MSTNARQAKASKLALGTTSRRCSRKYSSYSVARDALDSRVRRVHQLLVHRDTAPVKAGQLSQRNSTFLCKIRTYRRFMIRQSWRDSLNPWYINLPRDSLNPRYINFSLQLQVVYTVYWHLLRSVCACLVILLVSEFSQGKSTR